MEKPVPKWVPLSAAHRIEALLASNNLTAKAQALVYRLTYDERMKSDVWAKLPDQLREQAGTIIEFALFAVTGFSMLMPRPGAKAKKDAWNRWARILCEHPPATSPYSAAAHAVQLFMSMRELQSHTAEFWPQFWSGNKSLTPEMVADVIENVALFYARLEEERQRRIETLPDIKRPYSENAPRNHFSRLMSYYFMMHGGRPLDEVVTALTEVAFNVGDGLEKENIRALRRSEKTRQKRS